MAGKTNRDFDTEVLDRMAEGESLRSICADLKALGCPAASSFCRRVIDEPAFAERYGRARELQCEARADLIIEEARKCRPGETTTTKADGGVEVKSGDCVERSRLAVDAMKWTLAKLHPKRYGDKVTTEVSGPGGGPIMYGWGDSPPKI